MCRSTGLTHPSARLLTTYLGFRMMTAQVHWTMNSNGC
jgi:hypothetical protein